MISDKAGAITTADARTRFDEVIERAGTRKERLVLIRDGEAVAAIVPVEDLDFLEELEDQLDSQDFDAAMQEFEDSGRKTIPLDEVVRRLGIGR